MTYKGSNWTRGELGHASPDRNPDIECAGDCGQSFTLDGYWSERYLEPAEIDEHEVDWLCDECVDLEHHKEMNEQLGVYV